MKKPENTTSTPMSTEWDTTVYARMGALEDVRRYANTLAVVLRAYAPGLFTEDREKLEASIAEYWKIH
jgi:hypothetical protein